MSDSSVGLIRKRILTLIREVRKANGFTQTDLSRHLKLEQSALSRIENEKQDLSMESWIRLCLLFQINPDCVMTEGRFQKEMERRMERARPPGRTAARK